MPTIRICSAGLQRLVWCFIIKQLCRIVMCCSVVLSCIMMHCALVHHIAPHLHRTPMLIVCMHFQYLHIDLAVQDFMQYILQARLGVPVRERERLCVCALFFCFVCVCVAVPPLHRLRNNAIDQSKC